MTAVARLTVDGHPLLVADLLTTAKVAPFSTVVLPTLDVVYGPQVVFGPVGLCQKIAILADNMIVGWAANDIREASEVITHLKQHCEYEGFNRDAVENFVRSQRREIWNGLELAGFILSPEGTLTTFRSANCLEIETPTFGQVALLGTGRDSFQQHFSRDSSPPVCADDPENLAIRAVTYGMSAIGNFLTDEQNQCQSLDALFGGGYEIATLSFDKFVKLSDVLYAFWRATLAADCKSVNLKICPFFLFRYEYYGDLLVIRSTTINEKDGHSHGIERSFVIPPVYRKPTEVETVNPPKPPFKARWICNYVQVETASAKIDQIITLAKYSDNHTWLQFDEHNGDLTGISVTRELHDAILELIENNYHDNAAADLEELQDK